MSKFSITTRLAFVVVATVDLILSAALHEWTGVSGWLVALIFAITDTTEHLSRSGRNP